MKNISFLFLVTSIGIAFPLTAKAETDAAAVGILGPLEVLDDIKQCQTTLKNLDQLMKLSAKLTIVTQRKFDEVDENSHATAAAKADAKADYLAASNDYSKLLTWRGNVSNRIAYDRLMLAGLGIGATDDSRQAAKDAAQRAREASTDAARKSATESARGGMSNCPDGH